ncbi:MAG TPA: cation-translocating P-type ATPase, partial [Acidimicrobiia bacterium]
MPVEKTEGDPVYAGTVVADGTIVVATSKVGADTTLARIIHRVEEAQEAKAPAQRFLERFARWYTPAVVALAAGAFAVSGDLELALTLLVIGCPGALVISIPVSIVAGIGRAARRGILVEGGEALEATGRVTTVAFDKTGTLTSGRPRLTDVVVLASDQDQGTVLRMAAAVETMSEHPLAIPVLEAARGAGVPLPDTVRGFVQHAGRGVEGQVDGNHVLVGTSRLMWELGIQVEPGTEAHIERLADQGKTALLVAVEGGVAGILAVADTVRPGAAEAVASLRSSGVERIVMLTGDSPRVARRVGAEVGVDEIRAGLLPEDKLDAIRELQASGETVAMVGDGVNDAPAMAAADVGIAMGAAGSDVAIETASMTLMSDRLDALVDAITLSRRTAANLRQNVAISVLTVVVLLAGVLAGRVHMAGGMLVHQASVLLVILNAIRLMRSPLPGEAVREQAGSTPANEVARTGAEMATP